MFVFQLSSLEENGIWIHFMLFVFRFSIPLKPDFNFYFRFMFSYEIWNLKFAFRFSFSAKSIETDNLSFCGNIKQTKMMALEDVLDKDFVCWFLIIQRNEPSSKG